MHLRRMCIPGLCNEMFCKYQLNTIDLLHVLKSLFPCWFFLSGNSVQWWQLCIKMLYNEGNPVDLLKSSKNFFIYLGVPILDAYMFTRVISSRWMIPLVLCSNLLCSLLWPLFWGLIFQIFYSIHLKLKERTSSSTYIS